MYLDIQEWINNNAIDSPAFPQCSFIRDKIPNCLATSYEEFVGIRQGIKVISEHTSKSVKLPVAQITWGDVIFTLRNNFYDWKMSLSWKNPAYLIEDIDFRNLLSNSKVKNIDAVYCEGFPNDLVYGSLSQSKDTQKFTVELISDYELWTAIWLIRNKVISCSQ